MENSNIGYIRHRRQRRKGGRNKVLEVRMGNIQGVEEEWNTHERQIL